MNDPSQNMFREFESREDANKAMKTILKTEELKYRDQYRIFEVGQHVKVDGVDMVVQNITRELMTLRPLRVSEREEPSK